MKILYIFIEIPFDYVPGAYELVNLEVLKFSTLYIFFFQYMGKIFCVEFQRYHLNFLTKYLTHTLNDVVVC